MTVNNLDIIKTNLDTIQKSIAACAQSSDEKGCNKTILMLSSKLIETKALLDQLSLKRKDPLVIQYKETKKQLNTVNKIWQKSRGAGLARL